MHLLRGKSADEVWLLAERKIETRDGTLEQPSCDGDTLELLHACLVLENPLERWVVNRSPALNPAFALAEVVWILNGRNDSSFLNFWNPKLPRFQGSGEAYYGAYGFRLRRQFGVDQIRGACEALRHVPHSRQVVLQIWDARSDLPVERGAPRNQDVPCNICALLKVRDNRLDWVQVMRSNDLILGLPHNFVQFTHLQEMFAGWLGCEVGTYTHFSDSLHVYARDVPALGVAEPEVPDTNTDRWTLGLEDTLSLMEEIGARMDEMRRPGASADEIRMASSAPAATAAAQNLLRIVGADAARRQGHQDLAEALAVQCTNPALLQLWRRWERRRHDHEDRKSAT